MGQTREQKVIKQLSGVPTEQKFTPIATEMFLPNHSGDHSRGIVNTTPTTDTNIPNKKYVDDQLTSHTHSKLVASDGSPDPALSIDATGNVTIAAGYLLIPTGKSIYCDNFYKKTAATPIKFYDNTEIDSPYTFTCDEVTENHRAYFQAHRSDVLDIPSNNTWTVVPFNVAADLKVGFTHAEGGANPEHITVTETGIYLIAYTVTSYHATGCHISARVMDDATEVAGSWENWGMGSSFGSNISKTVIASIAAGSVLELQVGTDTAGQDLKYLDSATLPDPTHFAVATISIHRICPV